jgi:deferrochelatase/peroxidase EfeB
VTGPDREPGSTPPDVTPPADPRPAADPAPGAPRRRAFLRGAFGAGVAGAAVAGGAAGYALRTPAAVAAADGDALAVADGRLPPVPFHGQHQAGVLAVPGRQTAVVAFDVTAANRAELTELLRTITDRARFLTAGGLPPPVGITEPALDSGVLGPTVVPDGLVVTVSAGSSLFDDRFGLASQKPIRLAPMSTFPDDNLDQAQCHGDLCIQLTGGHNDVVLHALRDIARFTRGGMQVRWRMDGFASPARPAGSTPRNLMGFMDGISNPHVASAAQMKSLVWASAATAPPWAAGGSYLVVRLIRMLVEFWDRVSVQEQEEMFGRRRASGAPLDGTSEYSIPDYAQDPGGDVIPLTAHMRLANPRTPQTASSRILRRAWNYDRGVDNVGDLDQGLIFTCYQQDVKRQFEAVQKRLIGEPLTDYISPFGGGYFFTLPGVRDTSDYFGRALLA